MNKEKKIYLEIKKYVQENYQNVNGFAGSNNLKKAYCAWKYFTTKISEIQETEKDKLNKDITKIVNDNIKIKNENYRHLSESLITNIVTMITEYEKNFKGDNK